MRDSLFFKILICLVDLLIGAWLLSHVVTFASYGMVHVLLVMTGAYVLGSVPYGLLLTRLYGLQDLRTTGSGNIGATNVLRTGHKSLAFLTLVLDGGKAALAVYLAQRVAVGDPLPLMILAASVAVIGHMYPVWLSFKGGKGVASCAGALLMLSWPVGLISLGTWLVVFVITRISSLAAFVALLAAPIAAYFLNASHMLLGWIVGLALLVLFKHKDNMMRLIQGRESKIDTTSSKER